MKKINNLLHSVVALSVCAISVLYGCTSVKNEEQTFFNQQPKPYAVTVVMTEEESQKGKTYAVENFKEEGCVGLEDVTPPSFTVVMTTLTLYFGEKSDAEMTEIIERLRQRSEIERLSVQYIYDKATAPSYKTFVKFSVWEMRSGTLNNIIFFDSGNKDTVYTAKVLVGQTEMYAKNDKGPKEVTVGTNEEIYCVPIPESRDYIGVIAKRSEKIVGYALISIVNADIYNGEDFVMRYYVPTVVICSENANMELTEEYCNKEFDKAIAKM